VMGGADASRGSGTSQLRVFLFRSSCFMDLQE
jgi:hypothetical protein